MARFIIVPGVKSLSHCFLDYMVQFFYVYIYWIDLNAECLLLHHHHIFIIYWV